MRPEPGDVPPGRSDRWRVTHVGRRVRWTDEVGECAVCGRPVPLRRRHHYVTVSPESSARRRGDDGEEVVFCTVTCLRTWGASGDGASSEGESEREREGEARDRR